MKIKPSQTLTQILIVHTEGRKPISNRIKQSYVVDSIYSVYYHMLNTVQNHFNCSNPLNPHTNIQGIVIIPIYR